MSQETNKKYKQRFRKEWLQMKPFSLANGYVKSLEILLKVTVDFANVT
jgi:hypothetical protein